MRSGRSQRQEQRRARRVQRREETGRTAVGRIIQGAGRIVPAVAAVAFPAAVPLIAGAAARVRAAKDVVREGVQHRSEEVRRFQKAHEAGVPQEAIRRQAGVLGFFAGIPAHFWLIIVLIIFLVFFAGRRRNVSPKVRKKEKILEKSENPKKTTKAIDGFSRRIGKKVYTSPQAWANEMRRRRKK